MNSKSILVFTTVVCSASVAVGLQAVANPTGAQPSGQSASSSAVTEFSTKKLKEPPTLPNVPSYTGKMKYISGVELPNARGGRVVALMFSAKEEQQAILGWYASALTSYQWKIDSRTNDPNRLVAISQTGDYCGITVTKSPVSTGRSSVTIYFRGVN